MYLSIQNLQNFLLPVLWLHTRSKEFVIWDYKSAWDQTRFAMHFKTKPTWFDWCIDCYLTNTTSTAPIRSCICGRTSKSLRTSVSFSPIPSRVIPFFLPSSQLSQWTRIETLATQARGLFKQACRCVCVCRLEYTVDLWRAAWKRPWIGWVLI